MTESSTIKTEMPANSGFVSPESSHKMPPAANSGIVTPPGTLKGFSELVNAVFLSFKVAKTVPR